VNTKNMQRDYKDHTTVTEKELREFGLITAAIAAGLFGFILPLLKHHPIPSAPWIVAVVMLLLALLAPLALKPVYRIWIKIGDLLGWINTRIILGVIFYLLVTPMGIFMRLLGNNDPMQRQLDRDRTTYRTASEVRTRFSMEKPY
jgi:hypothetical protein